jgi:conjugal transfer pilus assembly protein TraF
VIIIKNIIAFLVFLSLNANANGFYERKGEGWFWYQDPIVEEPVKEEPKPEPKKEEPKPEPKKEEPKPVVNKFIEKKEEAEKEKPKGPPPMSTQWLKDNIPRYVAEAQDNPTKENIELVLLLNRVAIDKAQVFAEKSIEMTKLDPVLSGRGMYPQSMPERQFEYGSIDDKNTEVVKSLNKKIGVYFFFHSECPYSMRQADVMDNFKTTYGIDVVAISLDGKGLKGTNYEKDFIKDNGRSKKLGLDVTRTPSIYLFNADNKKIAFIGAGLTLSGDLRDNIVIVAKQEGWINKALEQDTRIVKSYFYSDEDNKIKEEIVDDKKELSKQIRESIKLR